MKFLLLILVPGLLFAAPSIGNCPVFPPDNIWNTPVDRLPALALSAQYVESIGPGRRLKADFGSGLWNGAPIGIPFTLLTGSPVRVKFQYADESDPGPYPIPPKPPIEGGESSRGDRHILIVDQKTCRLYELYAAYRDSSGWRAGSGAVFDLRSNALRPRGFTSADAAGLPILPGLVRFEEVRAGKIEHALRFTARVTQKSFVWPARHFASRRTEKHIPPMGVRFRLKKDVSLDGYSPEARVILQALKTYGMILADNGSDWYLSGSPHDGWNNRALRELSRISGSQFEAVDVSSLMVDEASGQARAARP